MINPGATPSTAQGGRAVRRPSDSSLLAKVGVDGPFGDVSVAGDVLLVPGSATPSQVPGPPVMNTPGTWTNTSPEAGQSQTAGSDPDRYQQLKSDGIVPATES